MTEPTPPEHLEVFIPHWGDTVYLRQAVESVRAQSDPRWRLTVVDDATPGDATRDLLAGFEDSRISYVKKAENAGITENFRSCVDLARGPFVTIMGNDDLLLPGYTGTVLRAFDAHPDADIVQPGVRVVDAEGIESSALVDSVKRRLLRPEASRPRMLSGDRLGASLMHGDWLYWPSLCFRRTTLQRHDFRDEFTVIQDLALLMDMFFDGARLLVLPDRSAEDRVFAYRRHDESASATALVDGSRFAGERSFYALTARNARAHGWPRTRRAARLHLTSRAYAATLLPASLVHGRFRAAGRLIRHALGS